jgi:hypothetical protein
MIVKKWLTVSALIILAPLWARAEGSKSLWEGFRNQHPNHIQLVALSKPQADGTRVLIVSEPPPHATVEGIEACSPRPFTTLTVEQRKIGHDGWVRDVVATMPSLSESQVAEVVDQLHDYLFGTTYKAEALELPLKPLPAGVGGLDLNVSALELKAWALDEQERFRPVEGGKPLTLRQVFDSHRSGVFLSQAKKGLVLWSLPRGVDLAGHRARARQFAVDSDLVLGATATKDHLAVFGRERATPVRLLPPLRVEMLATLASVGTAELAQSYERRRVFAGRFDEQWDWAPIYLSPALINTEYGSLLNITDQLLKGWSRNGTIEYAGFDYPKPPSWPFPQPLRILLKADTLTYNWNTAGAGYSVEFGDLEVLALNRTGALPVSYIPESAGASTEGFEDTAAYELKAYNYFAGLDDPNLVRVVQYAGLYQIFHKFGRVDSRPDAETPAQARAIRVLSGAARKTMADIRGADPERLEQAAVRVAKGRKDSEVDQLGVVLSLLRLKGQLDQVFEIWGDKGIEAVAEAVANPRAITAEEGKQLLDAVRKLAPRPEDIKPEVLRDSEQARSFFALIMSSRLRADWGAQIALAAFADIPAVRDRYAAALQSDPAGWIRTPSIVISRGTGELAEATGGHNLSATISEFRPGDVRPGEVKVVRRDGKLLVEFNEADRAKIPGIVRRIGKEADNSQLKTLVETDLRRLEPRPVRDRAKALYPTEPAKYVELAPGPGGGGGRGYTHDGTTAEPGGWEPGGAPGPRGPDFRIQRRSTGFEVTTSDGERFRARSLRSLIDFLTTREVNLPPGEKFKMEFVDLQPQNVLNILKSCQLRAARKQQVGAKAAAREPVAALEEVAEGSGGGGKKPLRDGTTPPPDQTGPPPGEGKDNFAVHFNRRGRTNAEYKAMIADYNLEKVQVREGRPRRVADGYRAGQYEYPIDVEAPAIAAGRPSLFVRVRLYTRTFVAGLGARARQFFQGRLSRVAEGPDEARDVAAELKAELKEHDVDVEIDAGYGDQVTDSFYADVTGGEADAQDRGPADRAG